MFIRQRIHGKRHHGVMKKLNLLFLLPTLLITVAGMGSQLATNAAAWSMKCQAKLLAVEKQLNCIIKWRIESDLQRKAAGHPTVPLEYEALNKLKSRLNEIECSYSKVQIAKAESDNPFQKKAAIENCAKTSAKIDDLCSSPLMKLFTMCALQEPSDQELMLKDYRNDRDRYISWEPFFERAGNLNTGRLARFWSSPEERLKPERTTEKVVEEHKSIHKRAEVLKDLLNPEERPERVPQNIREMIITYGDRPITKIWALARPIEGLKGLDKRTGWVTHGQPLGNCVGGAGAAAAGAVAMSGASVVAPLGLVTLGVVSKSVGTAKHLFTVLEFAPRNNSTERHYIMIEWTGEDKNAEDAFVRVVLKRRRPQEWFEGCDIVNEKDLQHPNSVHGTATIGHILQALPMEAKKGYEFMQNNCHDITSFIWYLTCGEALAGNPSNDLAAKGIRSIDGLGKRMCRWVKPQKRWRPESLKFIERESANSRASTPSTRTTTPEAPVPNPHIRSQLIEERIAQIAQIHSDPKLSSAPTVSEEQKRRTDEARRVFTEGQLSSVFKTRVVQHYPELIHQKE